MKQPLIGSLTLPMTFGSSISPISRAPRETILRQMFQSPTPPPSTRRLATAISAPCFISAHSSAVTCDVDAADRHRSHPTLLLVQLANRAPPPSPDRVPACGARRGSWDLHGQLPAAISQVWSGLSSSTTIISYDTEGISARAACNPHTSSRIF